MEVAGAVRFELTTCGFGDRRSTIRTTPLRNICIILIVRKIKSVFFIKIINQRFFGQKINFRADLCGLRCGRQIW